MQINRNGDSFENRLKKSKLTKTGLKIAQYLLDNLTTAGFMSAKNIAKELEISDVTVIRFARTLGYKGYNDLQNALQKRMSDYVESSHSLLVHPSHVLQANLGMSSNATVLDLAINNELKNIGKFNERNHEAAFLHAAQLILASKRKMVVGVSGSAAVAFSMGLRLKYLVDDVFDVIYADPNINFPVYTMSKEDCLIAFAFQNYPQITIDATNFARKRGTKLIAITDKETSPLAYQADVVIICSIDGISFNSYTIPLLVSEIIVAHVANILGSSVDVRNQYMVENMLKTGYFPEV